VPTTGAVAPRKKIDIPWLLPTIAGVAGLCIVGGIKKIIHDMREYCEDMQRDRKPWERAD
jgi:hypothetical protein